MGHEQMKILDDYFLLYHGMEPPASLEPIELFDMHEGFLEIVALVLTCHRHHYTRFKTLDSFAVLVKTLTSYKIHSLESLYHLQARCVDWLKNSDDTTLLHQLHGFFDTLHTEHIISKDDAAKLNSLFDPGLLHEEEVVDTISHDGDFTQQKQTLCTLMDELRQSYEEESFWASLNEIEAYLHSRRFSIGITGVMNAGKSSLLNTLMGKELLGSSVVPETANLSVIKYADVPYAKVHFWSEQEWEAIKKSAQVIEEMQRFVTQVQEDFGEALSQYLQPQGKVKDVSIDDLAQYTSANQAKKWCHLIKSVEIGVDLDYLQGGIEIVDTPGLDDVVVQRETITLSYLQECDVMIHLMNVAQSATKKDIDFIIDTLMYQKVSHLLIVLTRIDGVSESALKEVIEYTKQSVQAQLRQRDKLSLLENILSSLHFIPVSSKMAMYHKQGNGAEAIEQGYDYNKTGFPALEKHLEATLFGKDNIKTQLILQTVRRLLHTLLQQKIESVRFQVGLLNCSDEELSLELRQLNEKEKSNGELIDAMKEEIDDVKTQMQEHVHKSALFIQTQLTRLQEKMKQRLMDAWLYGLEHPQKALDLKGIETIVNVGLQDGLIDVMRDYRYQFIKASQRAFKQINLRFSSYGFNELSSDEGFESQVQHRFEQRFITQNSTVLCRSLMQVFKGASKQRAMAVDKSVHEEMKHAFEGLEVSVNEAANLMSLELVETFFAYVSRPLDEFQALQVNQKKMIEAQIERIRNSDEDKAAQAEQLHAVQTVLASYLQRVSP